MGNEDDATRAMIDGMLASLADEDMAGLDLDDLKDAMSHPLAARSVAELMPLEAASAQAGDPAPDFSLPYLPGSGPENVRVRLSDHFGSRPVALIFGSYT